MTEKKTRKKTETGKKTVKQSGYPWNQSEEYMKFDIWLQLSIANCMDPVNTS